MNRTLQTAPASIDASLAPALAVSPSGHFHLDLGPGGAAAIAPAIRAAFERNAAAGLLYLGARELTTPLPTSLAFGRELAHLFMTRLCAAPDLAQQWDRLALPAPTTELAALLAGIAPMPGAEYVDLACLQRLWADLLTQARAEIAQEAGDVQAWLKGKHSSWTMLGRVCFHLAENKANPDQPFAFLATYAATMSQQAKVQHVPLGRALQEFAGEDNRDALLRLLLPVHKASEHCPWLAALVASGAIFHPRAWSSAEAHQFLTAIPVLEANGIVVRIPDWWKPHQPARPQVQVQIGQRAAGLGLGAMLDFDLSFALGDETLTEAEWAQLRAAGSGLVRLKGRWVEVDQARLDAVLAHWTAVQRGIGEGDGMTLLEGMRLLAGVGAGGTLVPGLAEGGGAWSRVIAGDWLRQVLEELGDPAKAGAALPGPELKAQLRPYQQDGVRWLYLLHRLGLGGCLADDMGLGKTVQVLALLLQARRDGDAGPHLLVLPASLIGNWQAELARFAPSLSVLVAHQSALPAKALAALPAERYAQVDVVITSYGSVARLPALRAARWSIVILDEAQAIKNPGAQQTRAVKQLHSRVRFALSGTPVENRLGDLWSLFDFICPGLLGSAKAFGAFAKRLEQGGHGAYAPLRKLVRPYILRRLKSDKRIIADLPDKTEVKAYCALSPAQLGLYEAGVRNLQQQLASVEGIARRGVVLAFLMRFKQICNHPAQWLGDGDFVPEGSGKFARLRELAEEIAARQEKVLVFTQFQEMTAPLHEFLRTVFGRPGLVLHGATPVKARKGLVEQFQQEAGPPFFVLSIKAGGTGLNLTAAAHVIHFDRWWNPAVENQASDRAYRIGQKKNVLVHKFICRGTIEEKIDALIEAKQGLSDDLLEGGAEARLTEMSDDELMRMVSLDIHSAALD
ncbi:MAG: DEAD/DEAH box helicase [Pseudomonadota bacterium]